MERPCSRRRSPPKGKRHGAGPGRERLTTCAYARHVLDKANQRVSRLRHIIDGGREFTPIPMTLYGTQPSVGFVSVDRQTMRPVAGSMTALLARV